MTDGDRDLRSIQEARSLAERSAAAARSLASFSQEALDAIERELRGGASGDS